MQGERLTLRAGYVIQGHADRAEQEEQTAAALNLDLTMSPFGMLKTGTACGVGSSLLAAEPMLPHLWEDVCRASLILRYARADSLIQLVLEIQTAGGGLTLTDIEQRFELSWRMAIRMRDAVITGFPQAGQVLSNDRSKRQRPARNSMASDDLGSACRSRRARGAT